VSDQLGVINGENGNVILPSMTGRSSMEEFSVGIAFY
jgi:hypothetical protein